MPTATHMRPMMMSGGQTMPQQPPPQQQPAQHPVQHPAPPQYIQTAIPLQPLAYAAPPPAPVLPPPVHDAPAAASKDWTSIALLVLLAVLILIMLMVHSQLRSFSDVLHRIQDALVRSTR